MKPPAIDIDYKRRFSLPFGLAPLVDASYINGLDMESGYALYPRTPRSALNVWPPRPGHAAGVPFADGSNRFALVPASTAAALGFELTRQDIFNEVTAIGMKDVPAAKSHGSVTITADAASRFRWDETAQQTGRLPLPAVDDGALVVRFRDGASVVPSGALSDGILENPGADHLFATHATGSDGEAARNLLRSPVVGAVRFERYRHLLLEINVVAVAVGAQSATGAIVVKSRSSGPTPKPGNPPPPIFTSHHVAIENIDRTSAVECLGRLAWCQLLRRKDVLAQKALVADWTSGTNALLQGYVDYLHVARASHRPNMPDPLPLLPAALVKPFEGPAPSRSRAHMEALIAECLKVDILKASLQNYVTTVFAELVTGGSWTDLGIQIPVEPSTRPAALRDAHRRLEDLVSSTETFLICYAGAPVGRAAAVVVPQNATPKIDVAAQESLSPFHLEALAKAGQSAPVTATFGSLAAVRVIDTSGRDSLLTTRDFLDAIVKGSNTSIRFDPELDFKPLAAAAHPYSGVVDWPRFIAAQGIRGNLDALGAATLPGNKRLDETSLGFWTDRSGLLDGGNWPEVSLLARTESPPTPSRPYRGGSTVTAKLVNIRVPSGFDEHDLDAVLRARAAVRDGRTGLTDIPVPLFLALLDRESYRSFAGLDRPPSPFTDLGGSITGDAGNFRVVSVNAALVFPYGMDLLTAGTPNSPTGFPLRDLPAGAGPADVVPRMATSFPWVHSQLTASNVLLTNLEPLLASDDCLDYLAARRRARNIPGGRHEVVTRSRSTQWMCIALQMACVQWIHRQLQDLTGPRHTTADINDRYVRVDEYVTNPPPVPGANANLEERRLYIAYWALVYVAFNTSPRTWNCWVNSVPDAVLSDGVPASVYLTYRKNVTPRLVEPRPLAPGVTERRLIGQRGHMLRFAAGLDAYLRLGVDGSEADTSDPRDRAWATPIP